VNHDLTTKINECYLRFEHIDGPTKNFWEIFVSKNALKSKIWLFEGMVGGKFKKSVISGDDEVIQKKALKLVEVKQNAGFNYVGEVRKVVDAKYKSALKSPNPQDLQDCIKDGYSPSAAINVAGIFNSAMEIAISGGHLESIRTLVNAGSDIDCLPDWHPPKTPLMFALESTKDAEIIQFLLDLGADVNKRSGPDLNAPLHAASSVELAKPLLVKGANVDATNKEGCTALRNLLLGGHLDRDLELIRELLSHKADINFKINNSAYWSHSGDTPLIEVARRGNHKALNFLVANGADLSACNQEGENALLAAAKADRETIKILLKAGADPNSKKKAGVTALMIASDYAAGSSIKLLVKAGADVNARDKEGKTALMRVAGSNSTAVKALIKAGASLDLQTKAGKTAVMYAAVNPSNRKWKSSSLKSLIQAGANLTLEDRQGHSALTWVGWTVSAEAAMLLLDAGLVPNTADGEKLIGKAIREDNMTLALKTLEKGRYQIPSVGTHYKNNLLTFLKKISAVDPLLLQSLTGSDDDTSALLDRYLKESATAGTIEYAQEDDLPDILKQGAWPGAEKEKAAPELPSFWNAKFHPAPTLLSNAKPLPPQAVDTIARMMLLSTHDAPISALAQVQTACNKQSLADFALSTFHDWAARGNKATDGLFQALGYWGDNKAAKTLTPLIKIWPGVQLHQRAALGLEILGTMGSDVALMQIQAIAAKSKYGSLCDRADSLMQSIATARNLSAEQLEDRLVPTFDLSDAGTIKLDFGSRYFVASVNEQLQPILLDANGVVIKGLPKATSADDVRLATQSTQYWRDFKKDLKPVASLQLARFEQAMSNSRRWLGGDFHGLLVNHPLLQKTVRGLVWAVYERGAMVSTFALRPDGNAVDVTGAPMIVSPDAWVGVPHPLALGAQLDAWKDVFSKSRQPQPFPQLARKVYLKQSDLDGTFFGLEGLVVPSMAFKGLKALGWDRDGETFAGTFDSLSRRFPSGSAYITVAPGLSLQDYNCLANEQAVSVGAGGLSPVDFSELVRELQTLKG
jgi:ankyrin repeat protein